MENNFQNGKDNSVDAFETVFNAVAGNSMA